MANLKIGSISEDVKKLQTALGFTGDDVDGIYGPKTEAAVIQYQKDNGLDVDGIAGEQTLGKLYGSQNTGASVQTTTPATTPSATTPAPAGTSSATFDYSDFTPDDDYYTAMEMIAQNEAAHPGEYAPVYAGQIADYLGKIENREEFTYDVNDDALYQQYKDQYIQQGQLAMEDTMGQAAALTGGYGNSYAQSVGQQVYNQHLDKLNELGLELYDRAYDRYDQEGQQMQNMLGLYMDLEAQERANYQTELENWYTEDARLRGNAEDAYAKSYDQWSTKKEDAWNQYLLEREDMSEKAQRLIDLMTAAGHNPTDEELADAGLTREQANSYVNMYNAEKQSATQTDLASWIAMGYEPTAEEVAAAGWNEQQFNVLKDSYQASMANANKLAFDNSEDASKYRSLAEKALEAENPVTALDAIAAELESMGFTTDQVKQYLESYYAQVADLLE